MRRILPGIVTLLLSSNALAAGGLEQIEKLIEQGEHARALQQLDLKAGKTLHDRFLRARALAASGRVEEAGNLYQALIKDFPQQPELYNNLAVLYVQQGKHTEAQTLLDKGMNSHPGYAAIYKNLSTLYVERARNAYGKALQLSEQNPVQLESVARLSLPPIRPKTQTHLQLTQNKAVNRSQPAMIFQENRKKTDKKSVDKVPGVKPYVPKGHEVAVKVLQDWARAWSEQDADSYVSHYVDGYTIDGLSRQSWVAQRHERLAKPKWIKVTLSNLQVTAVNEEKIHIRLQQKYASDSYQDLSRKAFVLIEQDGSWKILQERSLGFVTP